MSKIMFGLNFSLRLKTYWLNRKLIYGIKKFRKITQIKTKSKWSSVVLWMWEMYKEAGNSQHLHWYCLVWCRCLFWRCPARPMKSRRSLARNVSAGGWTSESPADSLHAAWSAAIETLTQCLIEGSRSGLVRYLC